ncbi:MAG: sensor histidine kinase [Caulobacter sp.]|nr:sensor histidine kinase [Caulobacter sp.]
MSDARGPARNRQPLFRSLRRSSLVLRLVLLAGVWSIGMLVLAGFGLNHLFRQAAVQRFEAGLEESIRGLQAETTVDNGQVYAPPMTDVRAYRPYSGFYWQIAELDAKGVVKPLVESRSIWDSNLAIPAGIGPAAAKAPGTSIYFDTTDPLGKRLHAAAQVGSIPGRDKPVLFMAAENRESVDEAANRFIAVIIGALVVLGAGLILAVYLQVRIGLAPLFGLRREVALVRRGKAERLVGDYPAELSPLAGELNALVAHNQDVVERQRTHVGNLAHALKTPLAVMLTEARTTPGQLSEIVERQAEAMRAHVEHHLRRARAAARSQSTGERTEVSEVLDELAVTMERIFQEKGVTIDWRSPDDLCFRGERQDLQEVLGNILENAGIWCKRNVRATAAPDGPDWLTVTIEDDGPGLPAERREEVIKRGARLDESAPGSGLGLAIVDELARAYGGDLVLDDSNLGGLKVSVKLPRVEG